MTLIVHQFSSFSGFLYCKEKKFFVITATECNLFNFIHNENSKNKPCYTVDLAKLSPRCLTSIDRSEQQHGQPAFCLTAP